ncbi:hypothetical protein MLD38_040814 [Melastoma candidum]|nr:hypothetical protein MLD38_040814 [Melastoma candidum]
MSYLEYSGSRMSYRDSVTVQVKGLELTFVRILSVFTSIDLSENGFWGPIPAEIGMLKSLKGLNLSHNGFTRSIPPSIGDLCSLEWLDLSANMLDGQRSRHAAIAIAYWPKGSWRSWRYVDVVDGRVTRLWTGTSIGDFHGIYIPQNREANMACEVQVPNGCKDKECGDSLSAWTVKAVGFFPTDDSCKEIVKFSKSCRSPHLWRFEQGLWSKSQVSSSWGAIKKSKAAALAKFLERKL